MSAISLRQLRYFDALVRHRHFGDAARASAVSQPALSMQIRELETLIGVPLVERRPRRVEITAAGLEVARRAEAILQSVAELGDIGHAHGRDRPGDLTGRLTLGIIPTVAPYLLPELLARLGAGAPDLDLVVRESQTERLLDDLATAALDLALIALPADRPGLMTRALVAEPFLMLRRRPGAPRARTPAPPPPPAAAADRPLAAAEAPPHGQRASARLPQPQAEARPPEPQAEAPPPPETLDQPAAARAALERERLLLLEEGHCFRDQALSFCAGEGGAAGGTLSVSSLSTLAQMAEAGMGVTLIPAMAARVEVRSDALECLSLGPDGPSRTLGLAWRATSPLADRFATLGEVVRAAAEAVLGPAALPAGPPPVSPRSS